MAYRKMVLAPLFRECGFDVSGQTEEQLRTLLAPVFNSKMQKPMFPDENDSIAISLNSPKIAALAFDKVLRLMPYAGGIPDEVAFSCSTTLEQLLPCVAVLKHIAEKRGIPSIEEQVTAVEARNDIQSFVRLLSEDIGCALGRVPTAYYDTYNAFAGEYAAGPQHVIFATLNDIPTVSESQLEWDQVLEFRRDMDSQLKYRRLVRWIDGELKAKSVTEVQDSLLLKLDDYEWGLKKHGIKTVTGALSCVLDPKFLSATSVVAGAAGVASGPLLGALTGVCVVAGKALVSFGEQYVDSLDNRRGSNYEVAYIRDIIKKTPTR